jgi:hypothetical protein
VHLGRAGRGDVARRSFGDNVSHGEASERTGGSASESRAGLEKSDVDADPPECRGRPCATGKKPTGVAVSRGMGFAHAAEAVLSLRQNAHGSLISGGACCQEPGYPLGEFF